MRTGIVRAFQRVEHAHRCKGCRARVDAYDLVFVVRDVGLFCLECYWEYWTNDADYRPAGKEQ